MPDLIFVGEAWGEREEQTLIPFFGPAGQELTRQLKDCGLARQDVVLTNTFNLRPPNNDLRNLCLTRAAAIYTYARVKPELQARWPDYSWPNAYDFPPLVGPSSFLHPEYLGELPRLRAELLASGAKVAVALGNTACWALFRSSGIGKLRGYIYPSTLLAGLKVLPTYHPSSILRQYANRPVVLADIAKAMRVAGDTSKSSGRTLAARNVWIGPELEDCKTWWDLYAASGRPLAVDIETFGGTITCIGFGTAQSAISIPFWDRTLPDGNYWGSASAEISALELVASWLKSGNKKILQNAQYDLQYLWKTWGMVVEGEISDTMLMHHALQPELEKGLGFLGSAYTDVPAWKQMRKISEVARKKGKKDA